MKHEIKTTDDSPTYSKTYRYPYVHKKEVQHQITKMLDDGIIRHSNSPWNSPIWIVPKKTDASGKKKWRVVVDYRKLNEKTIDDRYPIPNIADILDKLGRCNYFTTLDLASGFHQIELRPNSIQKTAFSIENGHYEFVRMPFGLKNAPATFQRVMDTILKDLNDICLVYLDDIIIFSSSLQEHVNSLKKVFDKLKDAGLKVQLDKSEFLQKTIEFLGHVITPEGIKPNPKKIEAIKKFPIPKTAREIKSFLGLVGYYRKFIKNFSKLTKPLTHCLKKGVKITHSTEFLTCVETCKNILTNDPILQYPNFEIPFNITTDASNHALGAVLSQGPIGKDLPIAYASRTLNPAECNYSTIEKELLAIVWAVKTFRPYVYGNKFNLITDHKPLEWLFSLKEPNSKLVRWRLKLEEYDYKIIYKKGKANTNADALSRIDLNTVENEDTQSMAVNLDLTDFLETNINNDIENLDEILLDDALLLLENFDNLENEPVEPNPNVIILEDIQIKPPDLAPSSSDTQHSAAEDPIMEIPYTDKSLNLYQNQIILGKSPCKEFQVHFKKIFDKKKRHTWLVNEEILCNKDKLEKLFLKLIKEYLRPKTHYCLYFQFSKLEKPFVNFIHKYFKNKTFTLTITRTFLEDVITIEDQQEKLQTYHTTKTSHRGITENIAAIKKHFYWPNLEADVKNFVNTCEICQKTKYERHPHKLIFNPTPIGKRPFDHLYIDSFKISGQYFITIIDSFSKFGQALPITSLNAIETANRFIQYFSNFGIPKKITCDNGIEFKNGIIQDLCRMYEIELHYTTTYNPNSNSPIERFHSTLIEAVRALREEKPHQNVTYLVNYAILSYNNSIHSATEFTPFQVAKGQLDFKNPFEFTDNEKLTTYINEHTELLKLMSNQISEQLGRKQRQSLERLNRYRTRSLSLDVNRPLYTTNNSKTQKDQNPFVKLSNPKAHDSKIISKNKIIHQRQLKPQRKIIVSENRDAEIGNSDSDDDNIPLSELRSKNRQNNEPNSSTILG